MKMACFSTKQYDRIFFERENEKNGEKHHEILFFETKLNEQTVNLIQTDHFKAVCCFVNDTLNAEVLRVLSKHGVKLIALRCAGYNNVDLHMAAQLGLTVVRIPSYSPNAVAEHAVALILSLNRKIHLAHMRVRESNFSLNGLMGFDLYGKTVGVIGTGRIGSVFANIMRGFGCHILGYDIYKNPDCLEMGVQYVDLDELFQRSHMISLHCPLTLENHHLIDGKAISKMRESVMLINTSRGAIIDTLAVIEGLKSGKIGYLGLDVYEEEENLFFEDLSNEIIQDDVFARLLTFPNVIVTGHQAFFTKEAVENITRTTLDNMTAFEKGKPVNVITVEN